MYVYLPLSDQETCVSMSVYVRIMYVWMPLSDHESYVSMSVYVCMYVCMYVCLRLHDDRTLTSIELTPTMFHSM